MRPVLVTLKWKLNGNVWRNLKIMENELCGKYLVMKKVKMKRREIRRRENNEKAKCLRI